MASTAEEASRMVEEAARRRLVLAVDHTFVHTGAVRKMRELVENGLGDMYYYDSVRVNLGLFQHDVSVIWDLAVHDLSILDHACAVSNCTTALHLALKAVGVNAGDEVITVSHSFIATANAVRYCDGVPVFVDIEADGYNIDASLIEGAITPRTKAILCVHQLGMIK